MSDASSWQSPILDLRRLVLFRGLLARPLLVRLLSRAEAGADPADLYGEWLYLLSREQRLWTCPILRQAADPWEAWLIDAVLGGRKPVDPQRGEGPGPRSRARPNRPLAIWTSRGPGARWRRCGKPAGLGPAPAGSWAPPADEPSIPRRSEREAVVRALVRGRDLERPCGGPRPLLEKRRGRPLQRRVHLPVGRAGPCARPESRSRPPRTPHRLPERTGAGHRQHPPPGPGASRPPPAALRRPRHGKERHRQGAGPPLCRRRLAPRGSAQERPGRAGPCGGAAGPARARVRHIHRRPLVRSRRNRLQGAQSASGGHCPGSSPQRAGVRHVQPPPSH